MEHNPRSSSSDLKSLGNVAFRSGDFEAAERFYTSAIEAGPNHILHSNRSIVFLRTKRYEAALKDGETCIEMDPLFLKGYSCAGNALEALGRYQEAKLVYTRGKDMAKNEVSGTRTSLCAHAHLQPLLSAPRTPPASATSSSSSASGELRRQSGGASTNSTC